MTDLPLKHHITSTHYEIIPLSMLSNHPCSSSSGCELAFLVFSLQNHKAESTEFIREITQNLHGTLQHCTSLWNHDYFKKKTFSVSSLSLKLLHNWVSFRKITRGRSPTSEDSGAWRIGFQNGL